MKIVVLVKYVPEPTATWKFAPDLTLDRAGVEGRLSELDEYAVEQAVRLKEAGTATEIVALTVGPKGAVDGLRKALAMGVDSAVHVQDEAMHGSDAIATSLVLAEALNKVGFDLVMTGMGSTDAEMSVMPSMLAERLGVAQATFAGELSATADSVSIKRDTDVARESISAKLPAVVSVTDQTGEARYPAFRAIVQAKKKKVDSMSLSDLGVDTGKVGLAAAATKVVGADPTPPRAAGTVITDDGDGASQLAAFLDSRGLL